MKILIYSILILLFIPVVFALYHGLEYTYRVMVWQGADYDDFLRFKTSPIEKGEHIFQFDKALAEQKEEVKVEFEDHPLVKNMDSFMEESGTYAFLVVRNDTMLYEYYGRESARSGLQTSFSTAKSVLSILVGIALKENLIQDVTDPITNYIPELVKRDPRFQDITIEHLLQMQSGLKFERGVSFPFVTSDEALTYSHPNLRNVAMSKTEIMSAPGSAFLYNDYNALLLGLVLERALGESVSDYLERKIWKSLGMEYDASWNSDEKGFEQMQSGLNARAVDFAKLGRLILKQGDWEGESIIDSSWIDQSTQPRDTFTMRNGPQWAYGYMWWSALKPNLTPDIFACGNMGQFIYVSSQTNTIIVRNGLEKGEIDDDDWIDIFSRYTVRQMSKIDG